MFFTNRKKHVRNTCYLPGCCVKQVDYGTTAQHLQACNLFSRGLSEPVGLIDSLAAGGCLKHLFFSKSSQTVLQTLFFNWVEMFMPALQRRGRGLLQGETNSVARARTFLCSFRPAACPAPQVLFADDSSTVGVPMLMP